jgi:hypothetical protein
LEPDKTGSFAVITGNSVTGTAGADEQAASSRDNNTIHDVPLKTDRTVRAFRFIATPLYIVVIR